MNNLLSIFALSLFLIFPMSAQSNNEDANITYLACEHGKIKSGKKFKPDKYTLDKLLKNKIKLPSEKKLSKLRCWSNPCLEVKDDLYSYGMKGIRYSLLTIEKGTIPDKTKVCKTILHSINKINDKEICEIWDSSPSQIRIEKPGAFGQYGRRTDYFILDRTSLFYSNATWKNKNDDFKCYISSAAGLKQVRNKFEEMKEPIFKVLKARESREKLKIEDIKAKRKL